MSCLHKIGLLVLALMSSASALLAQQPGTSQYKCMIQMTNYMGEGAYIVVSLINGKGAYEKTMYVLGSDKKWYPDVKEWHKALGKKTPNISAITGASVAGGDRSVTVLEIDNTKLNKDYKLRFESAVEDKNYHVKDLEIPLTTEGLSAKSEGTGYIRYVRFSPNTSN
ncbi:DUF2271 domain-containing protein [Spirosoma utsteinense]|uniref:DUF2271 domain-containing protein n=1 Tax=Spirosoma utsteinense TaxID=2585773 RepID=A0ABR6WAT0_9BACT|nr:DUF2271 domain-containing protein [Spirosoma utsteinense]MBC3785801.1 hypothetical protein [Spirosoma utsteinense]MBC3793672.1 hypothetical protein [Spirosoma utsteinense]